MFVIGTAGHVDHGKSTLVRALTGIDPDRLREEQARGMTIELGFAWLTLPSGREVSIVDVPGHERFVRHMLAGVGAIDLALFVVAADEGVMPQTREHLEILDLLEVRHGIIALTKCDLVDDEWRALVTEEVAAAFAESTLADAPIVPVSAATGAGLDALRTAIDRALDAVPPPRDIGRPRFGIDRVFTMPGFGTVVTGTLLDGAVRTGELLEAVPGGPTARVRGLQSHRREVSEAPPGTRVAINLAGVATDALRRGQVLAPPGKLMPARALDARVRALPHRALRHNLRVTVHLGADEVQAQLRVLGGEAIAPGEEGWAQLVLADPLAALPDDLFVLRVSDETVGGGRVLDVNAPRHRRSDAAAVERLAARAAGTPAALVRAALDGREPCDAAALRDALGAALPLDAVAAALDELVAAGDVLPLGDAPPSSALYATRAGVARWRDRAARVLDAYHRDHPLRHTMPAEELRSRLDLGAREYAALLPALAPDVARSEAGVARADWTPRPTQTQRRQLEAALQALAAGGTAPSRLDLDEELLGYLEASGQAVSCGEGVTMTADAYANAARTVVALIDAAGAATLGDVRDALQTNRRVAQALLETLDRRGVTRRAGEARVLVAAPPVTALHEERRA
ncbi:MAG: selenocysteine-specific translation elongation factor [Dehalococcoidia bacterium]|nr:selenocysteine-specific translation elongation factor [Dehalococcoidia bacterium]